MKSARISRSVLLSMLAVLLVGCRQPAPGPQSSLPTIDMQIGSRKYQVEIAADDYSRMKGLMERDSMPSEHGMIFVFNQDTEEGFWMHNTRFPLDILFIDLVGKVVSVKQMKAYDESTTSPGGLYRYAIELNDGAAAACGVKAGDSVPIPPSIVH